MGTIAFTSQEMGEPGSPWQSCISLRKIQSTSDSALNLNSTNT